MFNLKLGSIVISYTIRRSLRAKYVSISVGAEGVQVVAPVSMEDNEIIPLVENKREWIFNKFYSYRQRLRRKPQERKFISGEELLYMGENYPLKIVEQEGRICSINFKDDQFLVFINKDIPEEKRREVIKRRLEQWYIRKAKEIITERLVMAPTAIVDYVVVHELCHLKQMNHSPKFWLLVGSQISNYKKMRKWLKENGSSLKL